MHHFHIQQLLCHMVDRKTIEQVAGFITDIINFSFETGVIPPDLKFAKIISIFKQGDRMNMTNDRPISILSYFAKIIEKAMYSRLVNFTDKISIFYTRNNTDLDRDNLLTW